MNKPNSQVADVAISSPSLLSEPHDIRNLFSSYTYQSPELDSNEDFCVSPTRVDEGVYEENGPSVEDTEDEELDNYVNSRSIRRSRKFEIGHMKNGCHSIAREYAEEARKLDCVNDAEIPAAYRDSLSLTSEPPDIATWFSSYAYESPELDTADFDVSLSPNHTFSNSKLVDKENSEYYKDITVKSEVEPLSCRELVSNGSEMNARSLGFKNRKNYSIAKKHISDPFKNNLCSEASSQGEFLGDCRNTADESVLCRRPNTETKTPMMKVELQTTDEDHRLINSKTSCKAAFTETCEYTIPNISRVSDNASGWIQLDRKPRDSYHKRSKPDDKQRICAESGLTSRINDENSPLISGPRKSQVDGNTTNSVSTCENKRAKEVKREVFKETTNTQRSHAQEAPGKWRCPQKNKPNTGPPLKQLRLDRWVHRI
ncbi:hypothetical protein RND81_13G024700 [Saponaria officinalis]|uniref:Uncharacterized protein n=1 Tax=Saponaria officinalis TaxID=3572 RepID=A0AAW1H1R2_SAPOF